MAPSIGGASAELAVVWLTDAEPPLTRRRATATRTMPLSKWSPRLATGRACNRKASLSHCPIHSQQRPRFAIRRRRPSNVGELMSRRVTDQYERVMRSHIRPMVTAVEVMAAGIADSIKGELRRESLLSGVSFSPSFRVSLNDSRSSRGVWTGG